MTMGFLRTFFPWGWTCLLHFLVVEMRALYVFYGSVRSITTKIAISAEMQRQIGDEGGSTNWQDKCVKDPAMSNLLECVEEGVQGALWTLWIDDSTNKGCYRAEDPGFNQIGAVHLLALVVCGLFLMMCVFLMITSDVTNWRAGNYLHFTWDLEHRTRYKFGAAMLLTYTAGCIVYVILVSLELLPSHRFLQPGKLFQLAGMDMLALLGSSVSFLNTSDPPFNWRESRLLSCEFLGRPWYNVVVGTNDAFGDKLEHAILKARLKKPKELEDLLGYKYDGPLTQSADSGSLGDADKKLFEALGVIDEPAGAPPATDEDLEAVEEVKSSGFCCGSSAPAKSAAAKPALEQEQEALLRA